MPSPKPLPSLPNDRRRVRIVTPPAPLALAPAAKTKLTNNASSHSRKTARVESQRAPLPLYTQPPHLNGDEDDQGEAASEKIQDKLEEQREGGEEDEEDDSSERVELEGLWRKLMTVVSLEDKVAELEKENAALREQNNTSADTEKDRVITLLREQNQSFHRAIRHQNQLVARIANTISLVFQEYQDEVEKSNRLGNATEEDLDSKVRSNGSSQEIRVYSQFDEDSDSDC